jgi:hypothetical protein
MKLGGGQNAAARAAGSFSRQNFLLELKDAGMRQVGHPDEEKQVIPAKG